MDPRLRHPLRHRALLHRLAEAEAAVATSLANEEASIELFRRTPQWLTGTPMDGAGFVDYRYLTRTQREAGERLQLVLPAIDGLTVTTDEPGFTDPVTGGPANSYVHRFDFRFARGGKVHYLVVRRDAAGHPISTLRNMVSVAAPTTPAAPERTL